MDRRADLDWLRVIAFGVLILYHAGFAWTGWGWHVNSDSDQTLPWVAEAMRFTNRWRIPLIYMVAGGAIVLALGQRSAGAFAIDRVRRLLLPLVFGVLVLVPPQVYLEQHWKGQFTGSFVHWLPQAYDRDNLAWNHLWFVAYVLLMTFVLLPVFLWARTPRGRAVQTAVANVMVRASLHWLMAVPIALAMLLLGPITRNVNYLVGDWYGLFIAALMMLYGAFLLNTPEMLTVLNRQCWIAVTVGIAAFLTLDLLVFHAPPGSHVRVLGLPVFAPLSAINTICWLFAAIGLANRFLQSRPHFLVQATEALYPFYMIHQTVTVLTVYWLLTWNVPPLPAWLLTVLSTFGVTALIYAGAVRPWPWVRPLFGLKSLVRRSAALPASTTAL
jgi:glucans biosynthesis protein C